jgi:hypothetical protein
MQIRISKHAGFASNIILNIEIPCSDILHDKNENFKTLFNTTQGNKHYMSERLYASTFSYWSIAILLPYVGNTRYLIIVEVSAEDPEYNFKVA